MYVHPKEEFHSEIKFKISQNLCEGCRTAALINQPPLLDTTDDLVRHNSEQERNFFVQTLAIVSNDCAVQTFNTNKELQR
jgi:hypothetical protein